MSENHMLTCCMIFLTVYSQNIRVHWFLQKQCLEYDYDYVYSFVHLYFTVLENLILLLEFLINALFSLWRRLLTSRDFEDKWNGPGQIYSTITGDERNVLLHREGESLTSREDKGSPGMTTHRRRDKEEWKWLSASPHFRHLSPWEWS